MAETNLMVWGYGTMVLGLGSLVYEGLFWYARDQSRADADLATWSAANSMVTMHGAMMAGVTLELWAQRENWMMAQWMQLDDDMQGKMMGDKDMDDMPKNLYALLF